MPDMVKRSIRVSFWEGAFANIMGGFSESFFVPYAIAMQATPSLIGAIASLPNLIGSLLQAVSVELIDKVGSRRKVMLWAILVQAIVWMPMIACPYIFGPKSAYFLLMFYSIFLSSGHVAFPSWSSLMSDYIPESERGRFFGSRNRIMGIINLVCMFAAGCLLNAVKARHPQAAFLGFTCIFSIACVSRFVSWGLLTKLYEKVHAPSQEERLSLIGFLGRVHKTNFGRFVIFVSVMNLATFIAAPFFTVFMLSDLKLDYMKFTILLISQNIAGFFSMKMWGTHADHVGNRRVLRLTSIFIPFIPLLWLASHNFIYLLAIQAFSGFFWAGFNLSASNFIFDASSPARRARYVAYFNVTNGVFIFLGATLGATLMKQVPQMLGYKAITVFFISGMLRFAAWPLCSLFREVRHVKKVSNFELFCTIIGLRADVYDVRNIRW